MRTILDIQQDKLNKFYNQKPKYTITVKDNNTTYELNINRKLTIIQGDSGIGKTNLLRILKMSEDFNNIDSSEYKSKVISPVEYVVNPTKGRISDEVKLVFLDEFNIYAVDYKLLKILIEEDKYIVIVTRDTFTRLSYPISELYTISTDVINEQSTKIKNNFYRIYGKLLIPNKIGKDFDKIIVEDSKSGFYFYKEYFKCDTITANGRGNVFNTISKLIKENKYGKYLVIIDSANYGSEIKLLAGLVNKYSINILTFECFEFLILQSLQIFNNLSEYLNTNLMQNSNLYSYNMEKLFELLLILSSRFVDSLVDSKSIEYSTDEIKKLVNRHLVEDSIRHLHYDKSKNIYDTFTKKVINEIISFLNNIIEEDKKDLPLWGGI